MQQLMALGSTAFEWREMPEPRLLAPTDAMVRPLAVAVCDADVLYMRGALRRRDPFCFGHEFVAEIVALGDEVAGFAIGDRVVVAFLIACGSCVSCRRGLPAACTTVSGKAAYGFGIFGDWGGALCDLIRVPFASYMMERLPSGVSPAAAASVGDNLSDAFRCVAEGLDEEPGAPVLVVAGGGGTPSIGLYAAALAMALGSERVDYLDSDPARLALAESLGAKAIESSAAPKHVGSYHVTADVSGDPSGAWLSTALRSTAPYGRCTSCGVFHRDAPVPLGAMYDRGVRFTVGWSNPQANMARVLALLEAVPGMLDSIHTVAPWDEAIDRLAAPPTKLILVRPEAM
jgi:alcohol dehydrogenase